MINLSVFGVLEWIKGNTYQLGWIQPTFRDRFLGNKSAVWHNGMVGGYASYLAIDRDSHTGIVVLANQCKAPDALGRELMQLARARLAPVNNGQPQSFKVQ